MTNRRKIARRLNTVSRHAALPVRHIPSGQRTSLLLTSVAVTALCLGMTAARAGGPALPTGGSVTSGTATIGAPANNNMTINQSSRAAIINWNTFSIGNGGAVNFNNGSGATLNRVTGNVPSQLDGSLTATGSLYLVNPAGVVVGTTGRISTGGSFIASTQDVSDGDFLAGKAMTFSGASKAAIVNYGKIGSLGGDVALIARQVVNNGTVNARNGTVALAAGYEVLMNDATLSDGKFLVKVGGADTSAGTTGVIRAANVELKANGGNVYALAGNTSGITKATGLNTSGGKIIFSAGNTGTVNVTQKLVARRHVTTADGKRAIQGGDVDIEGGNVTVGSKIDARGKGAAGGTVVVTGTDVTLTSTAAIDASGTTGGTILVGGDRHGGSDPAQDFVSYTVADATNTTIAQGATLSANGSNGNGGNIVVWSNQHTNFGGAISATGTNGNGGFAEVSSEQLLGFHGTANLLSTTGGTIGTLLLDPADITISNAADTDAGNPAPTGATSNLNVSTLEGLLNGASVTVTTSSGTGGTGNITVSNAITWTSASMLTLHADNDITINADITATNGGLTLSALSTGAVITAATITDTNAINVGHFILQQGTWIQNQATLPGFTAKDFELVGGATATTSALFLRFTGGSGAAGSPFQIADIYGLQGIASGVNNSARTVGNSGNLLKASYVLTQDIDALVTNTWNPNGDGTFAGFIPIGKQINTSGGQAGLLIGGFTGTFDGQGHVIQNIFINSSSLAQVGLFGFVTGNTAVIQNLGMVGGSVTGVGLQDGSNNGVGAMIGLSNASFSTFSNLYAEQVSVTGGPFVPTGGLVGVLGSTLNNSYTTGTVTGDGSAGVGGLVGSGGTINTSFTTGVVQATGGTSTEGLFGGLSGEGSTVTNSYSTASVDGGTNTSGFLGGVAGLVGANGPDFSGTGFAAAITNSYFAGTVHGTGNLLCGIECGVSGTSTMLNGVYWSTASGASNASVVILPGGVVTFTDPTGTNGLTLEQMHDAASIATNFAGFTFSTTGAPGTWAPPDANNLPGIYGVSHIVVVTPDNQTVAVGGTIPTLTGTVTGLQGQDALSTNPTYSSSSTDTSTPTTVPFQINVSNAGDLSASTPGGIAYRIITNTGTLTIQSSIGVNYQTASQTTTYNGNPVAPGSVAVTFTLAGTATPVVDSGLIGTVGFYLNGAPVTNVVSAGTYQEMVTGLTGAHAGLYSLSGNGLDSIGTLTINPAQLVLSRDGTVLGTKTYDGTTGITVSDSGAVDSTGFVNSTDAANLTLTLNAQYGDKNVGASKSVTGSYSLTGTGSGNYTVVDGSGNAAVFTGTAAITPATLTIATAGSVNGKTYDGGTSATVLSNGALGGVFGSDTVTLALGGVSFGNKNAGSESVSGTYSIGGADAGNYQFAPGVVTAAFTGTAMINKATLTIATAGTVSDKTYDGTTAAAVLTSGSLGGVVGTDGVTLTLGGTTFADKNAGTAKTVTGTYTLGGADAGNYQFASGNATTAFSGTATINQAGLTIVNAGTVQDKVYDGTTNASIAGATFNGLVSGDSVTLGVSGGFADKNVGTNKAVNGSYSLTGTDSGNYQLTNGTSFSGTASITPATLTIATAGTVNSKTYDGGTSATVLSNGALGGVFGSDTVTLALGGVSFGNKNAGSESVSGTYSISGTDAGNYQFAPGVVTTAFTGTAMINKATLTIATAGTVSDKTYDGTTAASVLTSGSLGGVVGTDGVTLSLGGTTFADKNAGTAKTVTGTYTLGGADAGNYQFASGNATTVFSGTATINQAGLTIVNAGTVQDKVYDGTTNASIAGATFNGLVSGDSVTLGVSGGFADKNVGVNKAVNGSYSLTGTDSGNYQLTNGTSFSGIASITPATLTIATAGSVNSKTYDGTAAATAASNGILGGVVSGDNITLALNGLTFADANAGAGKAVTGTYALMGNDAGNYQFTGGGLTSGFTGSATINAATLTYVANSASVLTGSSIPALSGMVTGFVNGETLAGATTGSVSWSSTADASSPAGSYAITGSGLTANNGNYVFAQAAGNATALTITSPTPTGGGGGGSSLPSTLSEIVAQANILNPYVTEPGSSPTGITTGQTNSSNAFWSYSTSSSFSNGNGGSPSQAGGGGNGFRGGNAPGGSNNPGTVYPDNARFGQWLRFTSR